LSAKIFEVTDVMKHADFDVIIIETVGVGQSEVEIAGIADSTAVVLVPEAGDEVQTLKSGLMEIADIFVINKSDREGADIFVKNLSALVHGRGASDWQIPVLKTVATTRAGVPELWEALMAHNASIANSERSSQLMTEKAFQLIVMHKMKGISKEEIFNKIQTEANKNGFNLYQFLQDNYFN
jgi:LAO/AO transport system kinase